MKKPFRRWLAALMAASMTLALTACSGGDNSSTASASGDKMFNVVMTSNYSGFDPLRTNDSVSSSVNNQIYETLYRLEDDGSFTPQLAESLPEYSEDGKTVTVKLRSGVTFHDGTPFNADAVINTFNCIKDPDFGSTRASLASSIESMEAPDENTVVFHLSYPDGVFLAKLSHVNSAIVSPTAQQNQDLMVQPCGTGPYRKLAARLSKQTWTKKAAFINDAKVSDHHAIIPTMEFVQKGFDGLAEGEKKLLSLVCCKLLCAVAAPHVYEAVTATFTCAGNTFTAKGKTILTPGWKELDRRFKASFKTDADDTAPEPARELPEITEGQTFDKVTAAVTEHFTAPPKSYTEDTLLSAMERAGADDLPEDAERQGLGTPATRASILEKLVQMGFVERRGKQLLPTKDGHNLACVLPEVLTSPQLTAQWETELTAIAKGQADPEGFMAGIAEMTRGLIVGYSQISEDAQKLFQTERVVIGKCPRCGESVYEGKKNYYCGNRSCQFVMWKNDRFFEERGKAFTPKIAAALLKDGKAKVKGLRSMKTGKTYDGTVLLADTGGKYVNYRVEQRGKN